MSPSLCSPLCIPLQSPLDFYPVHLELYPVPVSIGSFIRDLTIDIQSHKPIPNFFLAYRRSLAVFICPGTEVATIEDPARNGVIVGGLEEV